MTRMTWERFELTGAVEDYLRYKGIDWREEGQARAVCAEQGTERRNTENGTDDHSDGNLSLIHICLTVWSESSLTEIQKRRKAARQKCT